jgi:hypothetical protein
MNLKTLGFLCSALLILSLTSPLTAQTTFQRTYGGADYDEAYSVVQTADDGYIIVGGAYSFGAGGCDVYLIKTDASGDTVWTRTFGGTDRDYGYSVAQTADDGYIIVGGAYSFGAGGCDVYLIKTDASGDTIWTRTFGGAENDYGYSVLQTADGGYVIAGYTKSFGVGWTNVWLIKTDASGNTMWTRTFGGASHEHGYSVAQTTDSGYVIVGKTGSFGAGQYDVWLIKTDASGDTIWTRTFGGASHDYGYSVAQTADGRYIVAGRTFSFGVGLYDVWLLKTDSNGDIMWTRTFGGDTEDYGYSVAQTADDGYIIVGGAYSFGAGGCDVYLIKTDASGDTMWTRTYGGADDDYGYSVAQTADGGYVIAGKTKSFGAGSYDAWLIKTDSAGRIAIAEPKPPVAHKPAPATIARAVLHMPETGMTNAQYPMTLLGVTGRKVMDLQPGDNDVRHLSPGVYFVRPAGTVPGDNPLRAKVILTR